MSNNSSNKLNVPEARQAMDQFKMQAAGEVGVNLKNGYNGDLTSREAGSGYERIPLNEPKPRCIQGEFNFV